MYDFAVDILMYMYSTIIYDFNLDILMYMYIVQLSCMSLYPYYY